MGISLYLRFIMRSKCTTARFHLNPTLLFITYLTLFTLACHTNQVSAFVCPNFLTAYLFWADPTNELSLNLFSNKLSHFFHCNFVIWCRTVDYIFNFVSFCFKSRGIFDRPEWRLNIFIFFLCLFIDSCGFDFFFANNALFWLLIW